MRVIPILLRRSTRRYVAAAESVRSRVSRHGRARDRAGALALDRVPRGVEGGRRLVYVETDDGVVLIDPLVPTTTPERSGSALDRDVKRQKRPGARARHRLLAHEGARGMVERYDARIWAPSGPKPRSIARRRVRHGRVPPGRPPGGVQALEPPVRPRSSTGSRSTRRSSRATSSRGRQGRRADVPESWLPGLEDAPRPRRVAAPAARAPGRARARLPRRAGAHGRRPPLAAGARRAE